MEFAKPWDELTEVENSEKNQSPLPPPGPKYSTQL